jgi:hypothetical protein
MGLWNRCLAIDRCPNAESLTEATFRSRAGLLSNWQFPVCRSHSQSFETDLECPTESKTVEPGDGRPAPSGSYSLERFCFYGRPALKGHGFSRAEKRP